MCYTRRRNSARPIMFTLFQVLVQRGATSMYRKHYEMSSGNEGKLKPCEVFERVRPRSPMLQVIFSMTVHSTYQSSKVHESLNSVSAVYAVVMCSGRWHCRLGRMLCAFRQMGARSRLEHSEPEAKLCRVSP